MSPQPADEGSAFRRANERAAGPLTRADGFSLAFDVRDALADYAVSSRRENSGAQRRGFKRARKSLRHPTVRRVLANRLAVGFKIIMRITRNLIDS